MAEIVDDSGHADPLLRSLVNTLAQTVRDRGFPCIFARQPLDRGELLLAVARGDRAECLAGAGAALLDLAERIQADPEAIGIVFVDCPGLDDLDADRGFATDLLLHLRQIDPQPWPADAPTDPDHPDWNFWFAGVGFFFNFSSPHHVRRNSRNLGPVLTVVAQARATFDAPDRGGLKARTAIRRRIQEFDDVRVHQALGSFGSAENREIDQYFLGDDQAIHRLLTAEQIRGNRRPEKGESTTDDHNARERQTVFLDGSTVRTYIDQGRLGWAGELRRDSLLLRLGDRVQPMAPTAPAVVDLTDQAQIDAMYGETQVGWESFTLRRGELALFHASQPMALPEGVGGFIGGLSHMARLGLTVHLDTPIVDSGFNGVLTVEMFNAGPSDVVLRPGMPVAKVILYQVGDGSIGERYNHRFYGAEEHIGSQYAAEFFGRAVVGSAK
ncbi:YqcI/YcgG family protein [Kribbella catacumbae]|uniref:YqcI/YcgG family protein n=1 Tax=Kribbella catacumbae TaxID=460086 RepID=UPI0003603906|nr:YqcI/YcgG family protein [Kribbella catacumbae]